MAIHSSFAIVSNNPLVEELGYPVIWVEGDVEQIIARVLDLLLAGHRLLSHPLSGSIKPSINPYKSIMVSRDPIGVDWNDVAIAQGCLEKVREMKKHRPHYTWGERVDQDLRFLDCELIKSGIESLAHVS